MADLGSRQLTGVHDPTNPLLAGGWTASFTPRELGIPEDFEVYHMAITGPAGSMMSVFIDTTFYSPTSRGDLNEWDPNEPMYVQRGRTIYMYWNSVLAPAPVATIFCRQPKR